MRNKLRRIQHFLTLLVLVCLGYLSWYRWDSIRETEKLRALQEIAWQTAGTSQQEGEPTVQGGVSESTESQGGAFGNMGSQGGVPGSTGSSQGGVPGSTGLSQGNAPGNAGRPQGGGTEPQAVSPFAAGFAELARLNPDLKGWISIPGTPVSFPVVQGEDNSYYLNHDFYGERDRHGTIFADYSADLDGDECNVILYGHNMRDDTMFGSLKRYRQEDYYTEHPSFFLTTPEGEHEYEILAVLENDIFSGAEDTFQYYEYRHITDEEMYEAYCRDIEERSLYDTGVEVESMDPLVTLCTCSYGSLEQRFLIVGRLKRGT